MRAKLLIFFLPLLLGLCLVLAGAFLPDKMQPQGAPGEWQCIQTQGFGHLDHETYYYDFAGAMDQVRAADILLLGTSRSLFGHDAAALEDFTRATGLKVYNLSFPYRESVQFPLLLFERFNLRDKIVVLETDGDFFTDGPGQYAKAVLERGRVSSVARAGYNRAKFRLLQRADRLCRGVFGFALSDRLAMFDRVLYRSMRTGAWDGRYFPNAPQALDELTARNAKKPVLAQSADVVRAAGAVVAALQARGCTVLLSGVPYPQAPEAAQVQALAERLGLECVRPDIRGLSVRDGEHLTSGSARAFTTAFAERLRQTRAVAARR